TIQPLSPSSRGPSDRVTQACADIITNPSAARDRLTVDLYEAKTAPSATDGVGLLKRAFALTVAVQPLRDRMRKSHIRDVEQALASRTITADEAAQLRIAA